MATSSAKKTAVVPEYYDSQYWHPTKIKNWEVIDWAKWDAKNPKPPMVYQPPQLTSYDETCDVCCGCLYWLDWWSHRSPLCCCIPRCLHGSTCCSSKPQRFRISQQDDDGYLKELLDPSIASPHAPEVVRGVFWTRDNVAQETLMVPQNWAWKSTTAPAGPVGLGTAKYNWTGDPTCFGFFYNIVNAEIFVNVQIHPEKKWVALATYTNPNREKCNWLWIYVVQEGDEFTAPDGTKLEYFQPGSLIRISWDQGDPYSCDNDNVTYMYTLVRVADLLEDGSVQKIQPGFDELVEKASTNQAEVLPMCCGHCTCNMSPLERIHYQRVECSDVQQWSKGPPPPTAEEIDRL